MHPETQAKAFEEIDRVIGQDRLPTLADLENLPYIEALLKETFRWSPPLPISESLMHHVHVRILIEIYLEVFPHFTTEDTVYGGYFIPKGSMLLANIKYEKLSPWGQFLSHPFSPRSMLRNEHFWEDPAEFKPERFLQALKDGQIDPKSLIFGFGRR
jgi:cytochrome P450